MKEVVDVSDGQLVTGGDLSFAIDAITVQPDTIHAAQITNVVVVVYLHQTTVPSRDFFTAGNDGVAVRTSANQYHRAIDRDVLVGVDRLQNRYH